MLEGRGLFYGADAPGGHIRIFSATDWATCCQQARSWGIQWVHPKVADGPYAWYDSHGLTMLRDTAHAHNLSIAPYHYWWGNRYPYGGNPNRLHDEVQLAAHLALQFDAYCPDIESQWDNQRQWAITAGDLFRTLAPHAEVYPTLFANPLQHPTPYAELEVWINGWMPMVYFDLWTQAGHQMTAAEAIDWLYHTQWQPQDKSFATRHIPVRPILPIIELGNHLPPAEVTSWLTRMQDYGYCGFWYDALYAPYAQTIKDAPLPAFKTGTTTTMSSVTTTTAKKSGSENTSASAGTTTSVPVVSATPSSSVPATTPPADPPLSEPAPSLGLTVVSTAQGSISMRQVLAEQELKVLWHRKSPTVPWDLSRPLCACWAWLIQNAPLTAIGSPLSDEIGTTIDGQDILILPLDSGRCLFFYKTSGRLALI